MMSFTISTDTYSEIGTRSESRMPSETNAVIPAQEEFLKSQLEYGFACRKSLHS